MHEPSAKPTTLNIVTTWDELAKDLLANPPQAGEVFDLTNGTPDYSLLLEKVFEADSIHVW